jgi:RNA polymerase sigma-70 factor (sigma-E family)
MRAISGSDIEFDRFAMLVAPRLRRTAYLLCHDWYLAQDLTQTALAKSYASWKKVSRSGNPESYSRAILMRAFLDHRRRPSSSELATAELRETPQMQSHDLRLTLLDALEQLPPRDRAIVVLRYWEDQSIESTARILDLPAETVKKQSARSLARLRMLLQDERISLFSGPE